MVELKWWRHGESVTHRWSFLLNRGQLMAKEAAYPASRLLTSHREATERTRQVCRHHFVSILVASKDLTPTQGPMMELYRGRGHQSTELRTSRLLQQATR